VEGTGERSASEGIVGKGSAVAVEVARLVISGAGMTGSGVDGRGVAAWLVEGDGVKISTAAGSGAGGEDARRQAARMASPIKRAARVR
jgi:hypothetical protein